MKFANKYELFEPVTKGRVETFVAKDLASAASVLVHIFEAPEQKTEQPTASWVLKSFAGIAPIPPGRLIEAGIYGDDAYLVTNHPDFSALRRWIKSYESYGVEIQKTATRQESTSPQNPAATDHPIDPDLIREGRVRVPNRPGGFTAAFLGSGSRPNSGSQESAFAGEAEAPAPEPGEFTKRFSSRSNEGSSKSIDSSADSITDERLIPPAPGNFTALFQSSSKPATKADPERINTRRESDDAKAGDFTNFFQGPFDGGRPAETLDVLSKPSDIQPAKSQGEFTRVFGSGTDSHFATPPPESPTGDDPLAPGSGAFPAIDAGRTTANESLPRTWGNAPSKIEGPPSKEPAWTPPMAPPLPATANPPRPPILQGSTVSSTLRGGEFSAPENATRVFSNPGNDSASTAPPLPAGPSEYTRIISGGLRELIPKEAQSAASGSPTPPGGVPVFNMPAAPAVPLSPIVAPPQAPRFQPPVIAPPAAPAIPQMGTEAPKGKMSYLPLIIILNILLILAILLIVYFAIKH